MSQVPLPERLRTLPRASLRGAPTPVERLDLFEAVIGSRYPILIKRDDAIPFGFGGNKVRKLELVMAEAMGARSTTVITCGGVQSNHCRATAAAAARLVREGTLRPGSSILFWHTGGQIGVLA